MDWASSRERLSLQVACFTDMKIRSQNVTTVTYLCDRIPRTCPLRFALMSCFHLLTKFCPRIVRRDCPTHHRNSNILFPSTDQVLSKICSSGLSNAPSQTTTTVHCCLTLFLLWMSMNLNYMCFLISRDNEAPLSPNHYFRSWSRHFAVAPRPAIHFTMLYT